MATVWSFPLRILFPPLIFILAIPLFLVALVTSLFAITALSIRTSYVYLKLTLRLLRSYLLSLMRSSSRRRRQRPKPPPLSIASNPQSWTPNRRSAAGTVTSSPSSASGSQTAAPRRMGSVSSFEQPKESARDDYEGLGGWRDSLNEDDEAQWLAINSKLELPASSTAYAVQQHSGTISPTRSRRHHKRSWTGGSLGLGTTMSRYNSWYGSTSMISGTPLVLIGNGESSGKRSGQQSRNRTPTSGSREDLGYFGQVHVPGKKKGGSNVSLRKRESERS